MKKILFIISVLLISQTFAVESQNDFQTINRLKYGQDYIAVGTISATHEENVNFKPDTAEFSITYLTEGATPNNASNRNIKNMDELKKYLKTLGVKESDISTAQYRNYQRDVKEPLGDNLFATKLTATIKTSEDNIYNVIQLLEKNGISNLKKDDYSSHAKLYHFTVETQAKSENEAKKNAKDIFEKISKTLKNSGIAYIDIREYETKQTLENTRNVKKYFVSNTIDIKTSNFDSIGKIFTKAQELKMTINNNLHYSVSDEQREKVAKEIEGKLFEKLQEKAQRLITKKGFSLGAPSNIHIQNPYIRYDDYYESNNAMSNYAQTDQIQAANEVSIDPPSEYKTKFIISGSFDILQEVKR
ncbi:MAG: SIMPL domain-containing protein [Campylobacteraceae bacterium]|jgi:uncharacterized protein YggE|nr:SIMPL domain-containing protein [Campylobacteraceae bacterium]